MASFWSYFYKSLEKSHFLYPDFDSKNNSIVDVYAHLQIANSQGVKERKLASTCVPLKEKIIKTKHIAILDFETILKISFCLLIQYCTDQLNCSSEQPSIQYMHYWQKWFPNWQIKYKLKPWYNKPQYSEFHGIVSHGIEMVE